MVYIETRQGGDPLIARCETPCIKKALLVRAFVFIHFHIYPPVILTSNNCNYRSKHICRQYNPLLRV